MKNQEVPQNSPPLKYRYANRPLRWWLSTPLYATRIIHRTVILNLLHQNVGVWKLRGCPAPAPASVKREIIRGYGAAHQLSVFIETGTWHGDTVAALSQSMTAIYSIELSEPLFQAARQRFANQPRITLFQGDSGAVLPTLLKTQDKPCLFWLDGHFSGGDTACGDEETPILTELAAIFRWVNHNPKTVGRSVILVDDARLFGTGQYPRLDQVKQLVNHLAASASFEVKHDIIRIVLQP